MSEIDDVSDAINTLDGALTQGREHITREEVDLSVVDEDDSSLATTDDDNPYQQPWDQLPGETSYHYHMFCFYRDKGMARRVKDVHSYVEENPGELDLDRVPIGRTIHHISGKHNWLSRALSWDQKEERLYQLARSQAIREMVLRHEASLEEAIEGLMIPIRVLNDKIASDDSFIDKLSKASVVKLIDMANKSARTIPSLMSAERLARGMPTEIVGGLVEHQVTHVIERDKIGEVLEVLERAGVLNVGGDDFSTDEIVDATVVEIHPVSGEDND